MPYVIKDAEGKYLRRFANRGSWQAKREWVADINEATIWSKSGPAKSAANFGANSKGQTMFLQEVKLVCWGSETAILAKKPR